MTYLINLLADFNERYDDYITLQENDLPDQFTGRF